MLKVLQLLRKHITQKGAYALFWAHDASEFTAIYVGWTRQGAALGLKDVKHVLVVFRGAMVKKLGIPVKTEVVKAVMVCHIWLSNKIAVVFHRPSGVAGVSDGNHEYLWSVYSANCTWHVVVEDRSWEEAVSMFIVKFCAINLPS